jgi:hypothetical protein
VLLAKIDEIDLNKQSLSLINSDNLLLGSDIAILTKF